MMQTAILLRAVQGFNKFGLIDLSSSSAEDKSIFHKIKSAEPSLDSETEEEEDEDCVDCNEYDVADLVQENKYLRNELTMLCQRLIELEEAEKKANVSVLSPSTRTAAAPLPSATPPLPESDDAMETEIEHSTGHAAVGVAMLQIQKLEEELHRERLLSKELLRRVSLYEQTLFKKEDAIASLEIRARELNEKCVSFAELHSEYSSKCGELFQCKEGLELAQQQVRSLTSQCDETKTQLQKCQIDLELEQLNRQNFQEQLKEQLEVQRLREQDMVEMMTQLEENEIETNRLEELVRKANARIMALDSKCESQSREIVRLNSVRIQASTNFAPCKIEPLVQNEKNNVPSRPPPCPPRRPTNLQIPERQSTSSNLDTFGCSPIPFSLPWTRDSDLR